MVMSTGMKTGLIVGIIVLLVLIGLGVWWFLIRKREGIDFSLNADERVQFRDDPSVRPKDVDRPDQDMRRRGSLCLFRADSWCGACKQFAPTWDDLIKDPIFQRLIHEKSIEVRAIDCDTDQSIAQKYGVTGFPTLMYFPNGMSQTDGGIKFSSGRTKDNIMKWVASM